MKAEINIERSTVIVKETVTVDLPEKSIYFQEYNGRIVTAIVPHFYEGKLHSYHFVICSKNQESYGIIRVADIKDQWKLEGGQKEISEKILRFAKEGNVIDQISKSTFKQIYNTFKRNIKENILADEN